MEGTKTQAFWVGSFIVIAIVLLFVFSLRTQTAKPTRHAWRLNAEFVKADGLEVGSPVTVQGVGVGTVDKLVLDSQRGLVRVRMSIDQGVKFRSDATAFIAMKSLLGQHYVNIRPSELTLSGTTEGLAPFLEDDGVIAVSDRRSLEEVLDSVAGLSQNASTFFTEARDAINSLNENQARVFEQVSEILQENREEIRIATEALAAAAPKVTTVMRDLEAIVDNVLGGRGSLGRFMSDDTVYRKIDHFTSNIVAISDDLRQGRGTVGRLMAEEEVYDDLRDAFASVRRAGDEVTDLLVANRQTILEGFESLGRIGPGVEKTLAGVDEIVSRVGEGQGALGKLITDDEVYNEVKDALRQINQAFEQAEEESIMRTFLSVIFAGVN